MTRVISALAGDLVRRLVAPVRPAPSSALTANDIGLAFRASKFSRIRDGLTRVSGLDPNGVEVTAEREESGEWRVRAHADGYAIDAPVHTLRALGSLLDGVAEHARSRGLSGGAG